LSRKFKLIIKRSEPVCFLLFFAALEEPTFFRAIATEDHSNANYIDDNAKEKADKSDVSLTHLPLAIFLQLNRQ